MKKILCLYLTILSICFSVQKSFAEYIDSNINDIDKKELECMSKTGNTNEMNRCSIAAEKSWESEIKNSLNEFEKILTPEEYKILLESQKAWEEYKQKNIQFTDLFINKQGTMFQNVKQGYRTGIVKQRALDLKYYLYTFNF